LALRREDPALAARLLAASAEARGLPDRSDPSAARVEDDARNRLGDVAFAEAVREGQEADRSQLVEAALAP
jgi:hypothetical protein